MRYLVIFCLVCVVADAVNLPSYYVKCKKGAPDFQECLLKNAKEGIKNLAEKGEPSLKLNSLKPVHIDKMDLQASPDLHVVLTDNNFYGFENLIFTHIGLTDKVLTVNFSLPRFEMLSDYDVNGKILILPIVGAGNMNITAVGIQFSYVANLDLRDIKGKSYYFVQSNDLDFTPELIVFKLDNLFNGDQTLGNGMNLFLNDNWKDVYLEVKGGMKTGLMEVIHKYIAYHFNKIPADEIVE